MAFEAILDDREATEFQSSGISSSLHHTNEGVTFYAPTTRFYGSKKRILYWLVGQIKNLEYNTVLDAFGGTGLFSLTQKHAGKSVTYNDIFRWCKVSAESILSDECKTQEWDIENFCNSVIPQRGFISNTFRNAFYTDEENTWLDGAAHLIHSGDIQNSRTIQHCLFQACLQKRPFNTFHRNNLNLRTNCTRQTKFGNWRTWERPFVELMKKANNELIKTNFIGTQPVSYLDCIDASETKSGYDLVYLDPPYVSNKSDTDYMDRYHFLEGICEYHDWAEKIDHTKSIKSLSKTNAIKEWNHRHYFKDRLFDLIDHHKNSIVVLSYVAEAIPSQDELISFFQSAFSKTVFATTDLSHALAKTKKTEILIIGMP